MSRKKKGSGNIYGEKVEVNQEINVYNDKVIRNETHIKVEKIKVKVEPELPPEKRKQIKEYVDRIVILEEQAKLYKISSPKGITVSKKEIEKRGLKSSLYPKVWKVFKDKFSINSYHELPANRFNSAINFFRGWEQQLLNKFIKRKLFDEIKYDRNYLLKRIFGVAKNNGKTKEDIENYCLKKFGLKIGEAKPLHLWYVYQYYAVKKKKKNIP